jgi:hypothetical protein
MFVDHYVPYGIGLDATIFPGVHDLVFQNDSNGPLLIQSYTVGTDVFVNIYGKPNKRTVVLDGPYFKTSTHRPKELRALSSDEIGWVQTVTHKNGGERVTPLIAKYYKGFSRKITQQYAEPVGTVLLTEYGPLERAHSAL